MSAHVGRRHAGNKASLLAVAFWPVQGHVTEPRVSPDARFYFCMPVDAFAPPPERSIRLAGPLNMLKA